MVRALVMPTGTPGPDFNSDNRVDDADFLIWQANFGAMCSHTATLEVRNLVSFFDSGRFNLLIDGTAYAEGVGFGGSTGEVEVAGVTKLQAGRDHNNHGFSVIVAGGGFQKGLRYGSTDEFGFKAEENPVHVHDLHATMLHQLGLDHTRLTYRHSGRDFRLTDVHGNVVHDILT